MKNYLELLDEKQEEMLSFIERLVNIDSGIDYPEGIKQCAELVGEKLREIGFSIEYVDHPGVCTHLVAKKAGLSERNVMLTGHFDTVFLRGTANARPFKIEGDRAFGPGVADMKGGIAMAVFVLQALYEAGWNDKNMTLVFCGDEETGHPDTNAAELFLQEGRGQHGVFCLEPGRPNGEVVIGRKGVIIPEMTIKGLSAHAMEPQKGASAVCEMAHKILEIYKLQDVENGILCNVGIAKGGTGGSVVAEDAYLRFSIRFDTLTDGNKIMAELENSVTNSCVTGTVTTLKNNRFMYMPFETTDDVKMMLSLAQKNANRLGFEKLEGLFQAGGSDACWTAIAGSPTLDGMGPVGGFFHNDREYITLNGLRERSKLLALCIDNV